MHLVRQSPLPLWSFDCFDSGDLSVVVTTRAGGVSARPFATLNIGLHVGDDDTCVVTNRERVARELGIDLDDCVFAEQVAGTHVARVSAADRGRGARSRDTAIPATDGLVTTTPGITLGIMAADCMMIAMYDAHAPVLAVVHAGWPGTTAGIIGRATAAMVDCGASADRIVAAIGPTVSSETYQVGDDVARAAQAALGSRADAVLAPDGTGKYLFDLVAAARVQLADAGLRPDRVHAAGHVTGPDTPFYSHRFEGPTGRFAMFATLTTAAAA